MISKFLFPSNWKTFRRRENKKPKNVCSLRRKLKFNSIKTRDGSDFFLFPRTCSHNFQHDNKNRKMFSAVIENEHLAINSLSLMLIFMKIDWFVGVARPVSILELRWLLPIKMQSFSALEFPSNNKHCQTECNKNLRLCTSIEQRRMPKRIFFFFSFLHSFLSLYSDWWVVKR